MMFALMMAQSKSTDNDKLNHSQLRDLAVLTPFLMLFVAATFKFMKAFMRKVRSLMVALSQN